MINIIIIMLFLFIGLIALLDNKIIESIISFSVSSIFYFLSLLEQKWENEKNNNRD